MQTGRILQRRWQQCLLTLLCVAGSSTLAWADDHAPGGAPAPVAIDAPPTQQQQQFDTELRNPFNTTEAMRELANHGRPARPAVSTAPAQLPPIPQLTLRGLLIDGVQPSLGLLQIGSSPTHLVRRGDRLHLRLDDAVTELHVVDVDERGIWVEFDDRPRALLVR